MIHLEILGNPIPWSASRTNGKRHYNPRHEDKLRAQWQLRIQYRDELIKGPVSLDFTFFLPIPKSTSNFRRREMLAAILLPDVKPDTTNLQKFYEDCLKGIVFHDDNCVTDVSSRKRYSDYPRTLIRVQSLNSNRDQPPRDGEPILKKKKSEILKCESFDAPGSLQ